MRRGGSEALGLGGALDLEWWWWGKIRLTGACGGGCGGGGEGGWGGGRSQVRRWPS
jgi:hypothetical protein